METVQKIAYFQGDRCSDVARAHGVDTDTVAVYRKLVASTNLCADYAHMKRSSLLFDSSQYDDPYLFVRELAADSSKHQLLLELEGLEEADHVTSSSWNVMVAFQRFVWTTLGDGDPAHRFDPARPNVPVMGSENARMLHSTLYEAPQAKPYSDFEEAGCKHAALAALRFDLDGHPSNPLSVAIRRQSIIDRCGKVPLISLRHCGNHCQNLNDNRTVEATGPDIQQ